MFYKIYNNEMKISELFGEFIESEKAGGFVLLIMTIVSLILANSPFREPYIDFWNFDLGSHSITGWINDGLMAVFFLLIGLELEREIYAGELSNMKKASLPIFAAVGGMFFPALIYLIFNFNTHLRSGAGIPTATDIAFAIGILSLLGSRVPVSIKIFLTAVAVIDDLGAILIIAIFYSDTINILYLVSAIASFGLLVVLNRLKIRNLLFYISGGILMWYFLLHSGVHATLAGVILAFAIPFGRGDETSPSFILQHRLHKPVAFMILPLFALANTAITFHTGFLKDMTSTYALGIIIGLVAGKPLGIFVFSWFAVRLGISEKPGDMRWTDVLSLGLLGGIGFTMSIFILLLAFEDTEIINNAKAAILIGSLVAGTSGYLLLKTRLEKF